MARFKCRIKIVKAKGLIGMALTLAMMSEASLVNNKNNSRHCEPKSPKNPESKNPEPRSKKGQIEYWFRADGSFINEKQESRIRKDECVFKCFAINDKNALRKFKNNYQLNPDGKV